MFRGVLWSFRALKIGYGGFVAAGAPVVGNFVCFCDFCWPITLWLFLLGKVKSLLVDTAILGR